MNAPSGSAAASNGSAAASNGSAAASSGSDAPSIAAASAPMSRASAALAGRAFGISAGEAFKAAVAASTPNVTLFASFAGLSFAETIAGMGAGEAFMEAANDVFSQMSERPKKLPIYASEIYGFSSFEERQRLLNIEKKVLGLDFVRLCDSKTPILIVLTQTASCLGIGREISLKGRIVCPPTWRDERGSFEMEIADALDTDTFVQPEGNKPWRVTETRAQLAKNEVVTFQCGYSNDILQWQSAFKSLIRPWLIWYATPKSVSIRAPYLKNEEDPVRLIFRIDSLLNVL
jgi:hypothetical protein